MDIFVAKLGPDATEDDLKALFRNYGTVASVNIIIDKTTGQPKGIAFVNMYDSMEAQSAIDGLNQTEFQGHLIVVKAARPREDNEGVRPGNNGYRGQRQKFNGNSDNNGYRPSGRGYQRNSNNGNAPQDSRERPSYGAERKWQQDRNSEKKPFNSRQEPRKEDRRKGDQRNFDKRREGERRRDSDFRKGRGGSEKGRKMGEKRPSKRVRIDFEDNDFMD